MIAMSGSFDVVLDDGRDEERCHLNRSYTGLYLPPMIWREIDNFSSGSVCLVLASAPFDEADYLRDYAQFHARAGGGIRERPLPRRGARLPRAARRARRGLRARDGLGPVRARRGARGLRGRVRRLLRREPRGRRRQRPRRAVRSRCARTASGRRRGDRARRTRSSRPGWPSRRAAPTSVPVEPIERTLHHRPGARAAAVTPRTAAIVPVHLYGHPATWTPIVALARRHGLLVVEDAAQAHGARFGGRRAGAPRRRGGVLASTRARTSARSATAERDDRRRGDRRARAARCATTARRTAYVHEEVGVNSRLDALQAAFLRVKLGRARATGTPAGRRLRRPTWMAWRTSRARPCRRRRRAKPARMAPVLRSPPAARRADRAPRGGRASRRSCTTGCRRTCSPAFADLELARGSFPVTEAAAASLVSLPIGPHLDGAGADAVIEAVRGFPGA